MYRSCMYWCICFTCSVEICNMIYRGQSMFDFAFLRYKMCNRNILFHFFFTGTQYGISDVYDMMTIVFKVCHIPCDDVLT